MKKMLLFLTTTAFTFLCNAQGTFSIISQNVPSQIEQNSNITFSLTYTSTVELPSFQLQLYSTDAMGNINFSSGSAIDIYRGNYYSGTTVPALADPSKLPIALTPTTIQFTTYVVQMNVPVGTNYKWFVKINETLANDTNAKFGTETPVEVFAPGTLNNNAFDISSNEFFVNSKDKSLIVNSQNLTSNTANVFDLSGRSVKEISLKESSNHDLSSLKTGVYFIVTNDNRRLKFAL